MFSQKPDARDGQAIQDEITALTSEVHDLRSQWYQVVNAKLATINSFADLHPEFTEALKGLEKRIEEMYKVLNRHKIFVDQVNILSIRFLVLKLKMNERILGSRSDYSASEVKRIGQLLKSLHNKKTIIPSDISFQSDLVYLNKLYLLETDDHPTNFNVVEFIKFLLPICTDDLVRIQLINQFLRVCKNTAKMRLILESTEIHTFLLRSVRNLDTHTRNMSDVTVQDKIGSVYASFVYFEYSIVHTALVHAEKCKYPLNMTSGHVYDPNIPELSLAPEAVIFAVLRKNAELFTSILEHINLSETFLFEDLSQNYELYHLRYQLTAYIADYVTTSLGSLAQLLYQVHAEIVHLKPNTLQSLFERVFVWKALWEKLRPLFDKVSDNEAKIFYSALHKTYRDQISERNKDKMLLDQIIHNNALKELFSLRRKVKIETVTLKFFEYMQEQKDAIKAWKVALESDTSEKAQHLKSILKSPAKIIEFLQLYHLRMLVELVQFYADEKQVNWIQSITRANQYLLQLTREADLETEQKEERHPGNPEMHGVAVANAGVEKVVNEGEKKQEPSANVPVTANPQAALLELSHTKVIRLAKMLMHSTCDVMLTLRARSKTSKYLPPESIEALDVKLKLNQTCYVQLLEVETQYQTLLDECTDPALQEVIQFSQNDLNVKKQKILYHQTEVDKILKFLDEKVQRSFRDRIILYGIESLRGDEDQFSFTPDQLYTKGWPVYIERGRERTSKGLPKHARTLESQLFYTQSRNYFLPFQQQSAAAVPAELPLSLDQGKIPSQTKKRNHPPELNLGTDFADKEEVVQFGTPILYQPDFKIDLPENVAKYLARYKLLGVMLAGGCVTWAVLQKVKKVAYPFTDIDLISYSSDISMAITLDNRFHVTRYHPNLCQLNDGNVRVAIFFPRAGKNTFLSDEKMREDLLSRHFTAFSLTACDDGSVLAADENSLTDLFTMRLATKRAPDRLLKQDPAVLLCAIDKMVDGFKPDEKLFAAIDSWQMSANANLGHLYAKADQYLQKTYLSEADPCQNQKKARQLKFIHYLIRFNILNKMFGYVTSDPEDGLKVLQRMIVNYKSRQQFEFLQPARLSDKNLVTNAETHCFTINDPKVPIFG